MNKEHPNHAKDGCQLNGKIYRQMPLNPFYEKNLSLNSVGLNTATA